MGFQEAVRTCFEKYVVISGRARRAELWWWVLFILLAGFVLGLLDGMIFGFGETSPRVLGPVFSLATLLPSICVGGRRLHDRDMSAWWLLIGLIPVLGGLVLLVLYALPGTPGPNRFGPDPLGGGGDPASTWDKDDDSFVQSSIPRTGGTDRT